MSVTAFLFCGRHNKLPQRSGLNHGNVLSLSDEVKIRNQGVGGASLPAWSLRVAGGHWLVVAASLQALPPCICVSVPKFPSSEEDTSRVSGHSCICDFLWALGLSPFPLSGPHHRRSQGGSDTPIKQSLPMTHPQPQQPPICFLSPWICLCWTFPIVPGFCH